MVKYRFDQVKTAEDILEEIGRPDIPPTKVKITRLARDEETGEIIADFEIEIPDEFSLTEEEEEKLKLLMRKQGMKLKEKRLSKKP